MNTIRKAALAGQFYPADPGELQRQVAAHLHAVRPRPDQRVPKALIVPHAGYIYSGGVAAAGYALLKPAAARISKVVLLGPCHRVGVRGIALSSASSFASPLGPVPVDQIACQSLSGLPQVQYFDPTHTQEHSLEVHLPFLQTVLDDFMLVPLVVGQSSVAEVAGVLNALWGGDETLIVISSDLSHYLAYDQAVTADARTSRIIETLDPGILTSRDACGSYALNGLLAVARARGLTVAALDLRNSGDTAGSKDKVVGYGAWALYLPQKAQQSRAHEKDTPNEHEEEHDEDPRVVSGDVNGNGEGNGEDTLNAATPIPTWWPYRKLLLDIATRAMEIGLKRGNIEGLSLNGLPPALQENGAVFVTLEKHGNLRGCIGSLAASRPLATDVLHHAFNAAFKDPRFAPVTAQELPQLDISLSVLSAPRPMQFQDQQDLLQQLRPHQDGLIIASGGRRAVFLPSVWEQLPEPENFLTQLKRKAGMPANYWAPDFSAQRFTTDKCSSREFTQAKPA